MNSSPRRLRLGILLSGTGRTLENLIEWQRRGDLSGEVVCVASNRMNVRGLDIGRDAGLPVRGRS